MVNYLILFFVIAMVYCVIGALVSGMLLMLKETSSEFEWPTRKEKDVIYVLGAIWPISLPFLAVGIVLGIPAMGIAKAVKRLIKNNY
ncbi:hypothetical protein S2_177 [Pseudomonas phage vB_PaeM_SCUT-S2]|nr:hypothetical protein S2_177 [Pseudomonas phage vB_PaeM_SCUT-S2]